jgi:carboxyl-terminal processing protease
MTALLAAGLLWFATADGDTVETALRKFAQVYAVLEREGASPVDPRQAIYGGAIPGMLRALDPHSVFFDPEQFEQLRKMQESVSRGFGSIVDVLPGRVIVLEATPGSPAARAGLAPGDEIVAINGIPLDRLDTQQLVQLLTESRQRPANIDVRRAGSARTLQFVLTPEEMLTPSVERAFLLRPGVGYVRVTSFDANTGEEVRKAIEKLGGASLRGLVLDLRRNPGGLLASALEVASLFLAPGKTLVSIRGRAAPSSQEVVPPGTQPYEFPLAVLVDGQTASAAEIVAGCLQDHDRAVIVGQPTFGKGLVNTVYPLSEQAGLALTTAFYYTPSGRSIQRPLASGQLREATEAARRKAEASSYRTAGGRIVQGGGGIVPDQIVREKPPTRLQVFLEASGALPRFATVYLQRHPRPPESFEVTPEVMEEFREYLAGERVLPGVWEWSEIRGWIMSRLKAEIFNQAFGVEKGDQVEAQRDAAIQTALEAILSRE